jgi:hypothetical protein
MEQIRKKSEHNGEVTVDEESRKVEDIPALQRASDGWTRGRIEPRALDGVIEKSNVFAL